MQSNPQITRRHFITATSCAGVGVGAAANALGADPGPEGKPLMRMPRRPLGKTGWLISITAEQLVRYALNLPVAAAVIGMPNLAVVESCAEIARSLAPMPEPERKALEQKRASAHRDGSLPYLAAGYADGHHGAVQA